VSLPPTHASVQALLAPWPGPYGGLPPLHAVEPAALEAALHAALAAKRSEVLAIAHNPAPPTFANTAQALEDCGRALRRVQALVAACASSANLGDMPAVVQRCAPLMPALDDEIAHNDSLFSRLTAVLNGISAAGLSPEQQRLVQVLHTRLRRHGAGLPAAAKTRLAHINARLSALAAQYNQNLMDEAQAQAVFITHEAQLQGLPPALCQAAAAAATQKGRPGQWAVPNTRGAVWPFLTLASDRTLREQVWRMWTGRGDNPGPHNNKPLAAEMLQLRGELARLLGHASYAHFALADRMAGTPEAALALLHSTWAQVKTAAQAQLADYQAVADKEAHKKADEEAAEEVGKETKPAAPALAPWDRLYYAEKFRRQHFGLDSAAVQAHLPLDAVLRALFWAAGRVHGLTFKQLDGVPTVHASVQVFEASRGGEPLGVIYFDLFDRPGKAHGSYQRQFREAETFAGRVLPLSGVYSTFVAPPAGQPVLLPWEYANVFFHEFGHALHMLHCSSAYPSLGSQHVAWDFVELPALLNERWLRHPDLLARFARHHQTGDPIPNTLIERIDQALRYDRIFSLNPDYLLPAIVDLRLHLLADGSGTPIDPVQVENTALAELGMPAGWDVVMRVTHNAHVFAGGAYAAGLYSYLWSDVMAADALARFEAAPGGIFDAPTAQAWIDQVLSVGHRVPAAQAFAQFAGHPPHAAPLLQRFGLKADPTGPPA
jgi:peptidyl-dipeptidase Dcp